MGVLHTGDEARRRGAEPFEAVRREVVEDGALLGTGVLADAVRADVDGV